MSISLRKYKTLVSLCTYGATNISCSRMQSNQNQTMSLSEKSITSQLERHTEDKPFATQDDVLRRSAEHRRQQRERFAKFQLKPSCTTQSKLDTEKPYERDVHSAVLEQRQKEIAAFLEERAKARREFQLEKARKAQSQLSDSSSTASIASTPRITRQHRPQH